MSVGIHSIGTANCNVVEEAEAVAANRILLAGHYSCRTGMVPGRANSAERVASLHVPYKQPDLCAFCVRSQNCLQ